MADLLPIPAPQSRFSYLGEYFRGRLGALVAGGNLYAHQADAVAAICGTLNFGNIEIVAAGDQNIALVVLPTGTGKSGIAVLASYALNAGKVLVLTPSQIISKQIYRDFCHLQECFFRRRGIIPEAQAINVVPHASLIERTEQLGLHQQWLVNDLVIANAHKFGAPAGGPGPRRGVPIDQIDPQHFTVVIVDEAHHYPAATWRRVVDHFTNSRILFLTATPYHNDVPILPLERVCYQLARRDAVQQGIIRDLRFHPVGFPTDNEVQVAEAIVTAVQNTLLQHDILDPTVVHKAMILAQTVDGLNSSAQVFAAYERLVPNVCKRHHEGHLDLDDFLDPDNPCRVLIVIGKLLEGFDHTPISVVAIARNVQPASRVLFSQFVGRAVRKHTPADPVEAVVISHVKYNQHGNFQRMDLVADQDPVDDFEDV